MAERGRLGSVTQRAGAQRVISSQASVTSPTRWLEDQLFWKVAHPGDSPQGGSPSLSDPDMLLDLEPTPSCSWSGLCVWKGSGVTRQDRAHGARWAELFLGAGLKGCRARGALAAPGAEVTAVPAQSHPAPSQLSPLPASPGRNELLWEARSGSGLIAL